MSCGQFMKDLKYRQKVLTSCQPRGISENTLFGFINFKEKIFLNSGHWNSVKDGRNKILGDHCEHWNLKVIVNVQVEKNDNGNEKAKVVIS